MASEDENCPLCLEELDLTDKTLNACQCGYQVCLWCWHQIKNEYNGLCPACRTPYAEHAMAKSTATLAPANGRPTALKKKKPRTKSANMGSSSASSNGLSASVRKSLINVRVLQKNLVYVIGLPMRFANESLLKSTECFGKYGKMIKCVVNKSSCERLTSFTSHHSTVSAYVTFCNADSAARTIEALDGFHLDGRLIRASYGTTKYCNFFLRNGAKCTNPDCLYLHELGQEVDSYTKEEMQTGKGSFRDNSTTPVYAGSVSSGDSFPLPPSELAVNHSVTPRDKKTMINRQVQSAAAISRLRQHKHQMGLSDKLGNNLVSVQDEGENLNSIRSHLSARASNSPFMKPAVTSSAPPSIVGDIESRGIEISEKSRNVIGSGNRFTGSMINTLHGEQHSSKQSHSHAALWSNSSPSGNGSKFDFRISPPANRVDSLQTEVQDFKEAPDNFSSNKGQSMEWGKLEGTSSVGKPQSKNEGASVDEMLASMLGVKLTGTLAAAEAREREISPQFSLNGACTNSQQSSTTSSLGLDTFSSASTTGGLAFLQQMLPNVNISYGKEPLKSEVDGSFEGSAPFWGSSITSSNDENHGQSLSPSFHDPAISSHGNVCFQVQDLSVAERLNSGDCKRISAIQLSQ